MDESEHKCSPVLLRAASSLSIGIAAMVFLFGGLFLSIAGISRLTGELIGILLTVLIGWLGIELKKVADRLEKGQRGQLTAKQ